MPLSFTIPPSFTNKHRQVVFQYLSSFETLSSENWAILFEAMDVLRIATVSSISGQRRTFTSIYHDMVDIPYADVYIATLLNRNSPSQMSRPLWAAIARRISQDLHTSEFFDINVTGSRLLLSYLLYWWQQFARGYAFEIEIFQDLDSSHIEFQAHDLRVRAERVSPFDLTVSIFRGDIKSSTYFLAQQRHPDPTIDFYITRAWLPTGRTRTLVVFLKPEMWQEIDGDTLQATIDTLEQILPRPGAVHIEMQAVIVVDYELWKKKMHVYQQEEHHAKDA